MHTFLLMLLMPFGIVLSVVPTNNPHIVVYNVLVREDDNCITWTKTINEPGWHQAGDTIPYYYHEMVLIK